MRRTLPSFLALFLVACAGRAQTFVVGAGGTFAEIAAAVAAAPSGATLLVRAGTYQGFQVVNKSLAILCDPGALVAGEVFVGGIDGNQAVTLRGLTWAGGWVPATISLPTQRLPTLLEIRGCRGPVLLDRVDTTPAAAAVWHFFGVVVWTPGLVADACDRLAIRDSAFRAECSLVNCTTAIESSTFTGVYEPNGGSPYNTPGLEVVGGSVQVGGPSSFLGAPGYYPGNPIERVVPASAGLMLLQTDARFVAGTALSILTPHPQDLGGIHVLGGRLRLGRAAAVNAVTGGHTGVRTPMPAITSNGSLAAGALTATAAAEPNDLVVVLLGLAGPPVAVPPFDDPFWIDAGAFVFQAFGAPPSGSLSTSLPLPPQPALAGLVVTWQAIASGPATGFAVSNPSLAVVH